MPEWAVGSRGRRGAEWARSGPSGSIDFNRIGTAQGGHDRVRVDRSINLNRIGAAQRGGDRVRLGRSSDFNRIGTSLAAEFRNSKPRIPPRPSLRRLKPRNSATRNRGARQDRHYAVSNRGIPQLESADRTQTTTTPAQTAEFRNSKPRVPPRPPLRRFKPQNSATRIRGCTDERVQAENRAPPKVKKKARHRSRAFSKG